MAQRTSGTEEPGWVEPARRIAIAAWAAVGLTALAAMGFWLLARISGVLTPFILAVLIVYVLKPVVAWIQCRGVPRIGAVMITYLGGLLLATMVLGLLIPPVAAQVRDLIGAFPGYWDSLVSWVKTLEGQLAGMPLGERLVAWVEDAPARLEQIGMAVARIVPRQAAVVGNIAFSAVLAPIVAFYLLADLQRIRKAVTGFLPRDHQPEFLDIVQKVDTVMTGYLRGQLIVSLSVGALTLVLFTTGNLFLEPNIPYTLALAVLAGVLNVVPYFGPWATAAVAGVIGLFQSPVHALVAVAVLLIAQQIDSMFISPNIMSGAVDLHPALIILVLMVGASQFGIMGMLLAIPVAAAAKAVFLHFYEKYVPPEPEPSPEDGGRAKDPTADDMEQDEAS